MDGEMPKIGCIQHDCDECQDRKTYYRELVTSNRALARLSRVNKNLRQKLQYERAVKWKLDFFFTSLALLAGAATMWAFGLTATSFVLAAAITLGYLMKRSFHRS